MFARTQLEQDGSKLARWMSRVPRSHIKHDGNDMPAHSLGRLSLKGRSCSSYYIQAWYLIEAAEAIASMPPGAMPWCP